MPLVVIVSSIEAEAQALYILLSLLGIITAAATTMGLFGVATRV